MLLGLGGLQPHEAASFCGAALLREKILPCLEPHPVFLPLQPVALEPLESHRTSCIFCPQGSPLVICKDPSCSPSSHDSSLPLLPLPVPAAVAFWTLLVWVVFPGRQPRICLSQSLLLTVEPDSPEWPCQCQGQGCFRVPASTPHRSVGWMEGQESCQGIHGTQMIYFALTVRPETPSLLHIFPILSLCSCFFWPEA